MRQSKLMSFFESIGGTAIGFVVAFFANMFVLPWFGLSPSISENLLITTIYTAISIARGFGVRRVFEALHIRRPLSPFMQAAIYERYRQVEAEGYTLLDDDNVAPGYLSEYAIDYAARWRDEENPSHQRRHLVKAGALIIAEGEKFDRARKSRRVFEKIPENQEATDRT